MLLVLYLYSNSLDCMKYTTSFVIKFSVFQKFTLLVGRDAFSPYSDISVNSVSIKILYILYMQYLLDKNLIYNTWNLP